MGWWRRLLGQGSETKSDPFALVERRNSAVEAAVLASLEGARSTAAGVAVSEEGALRHTAVLACVRILANSVAMLPLPVYRRLERGKQRAPDHPLYRILQEQANPEMTAFELRRCQEHLSSSSSQWHAGNPPPSMETATYYVGQESRENRCTLRIPISFPGCSIPYLRPWQALVHR